MKPRPRYPDPEHVRRRFAVALRPLAGGKRFPPAERIELARMADVWAKTLPLHEPEDAIRRGTLAGRGHGKR